VSIKLIDVTKTFARQTGNEYVEAVRNLSIDINEGSLTLIGGPTGSGKTTLLSLLSGILRPTSGEIVLNTVHSSASGDSDISIFRERYIGYVSQDILLVHDLNCIENVLFPNIFRHEPVKRLKHRAMELLERLGLSSKTTGFPFELSGGEQKKVMIARALVSSPQYIIADEPVSELDRVSGDTILALFEEYNKKGSAVVVASHTPVAFDSPYDIYMLDHGSITSYKKGGKK
jgi:putative ABC transport system ATP-binding protein